jgi:hypothetical protein
MRGPGSIYSLKDERCFLCEEMTMRRKLQLISTAAVLLSAGLFAQQASQIPFQVSVTASETQPAPPLQSFAIATDQGKWLLIGGRTNGFHRTSTREATFPIANSNEDIYVVDPAAGRAWKSPVPQPFLYQLRSTNMEYYQDGNILYLVGGYGSKCDSDKPECYITFPNLTAVHVHEIVAAIINGQKDISSFITTTKDDRMKVTGGELLKLGDNFYLVFGQDFEGIYKGGITGHYTDQVRRFRINLSGSLPAVTDYHAFSAPDGGGVDSQYHRRDMNVVEAVRAPASGLTVYGGVFTKTAGAWTNPVYIDQDSAGNTKITVDTGFSQKMSQYTCAHLLMFSTRTQVMYTTLFGGISLWYFDRSGTLVPSNLDNYMPFINSITTLSRAPNGQTTESPQPPSQALPELMGANGVFIPATASPRVPGNPDVINLDALPSGETFVGYLYGGIHALSAQVSFINPSYADSTIYRVLVTKTAP